MWERFETKQRMIAIILAVVGTALYLGWSVRPATVELSYGYASYYTAAALLRDGVDADRLYDHDWFLDQARAAGFVETPDIFNINPPPTALVLLPFSGLSPEVADLAWTLTNVGLLVLAVGMLFRTLSAAGFELSPSGPVFWALVALIAVFNPIWENTFFGQMYVLLFLFLVLAMRAYVLDQDGRFGIWLGLLFATKSAGALLWGLMILGRKFRAVAAGIVTILAVALVASPVLGFSVWWEYIQRIPGLFDQPWSGLTAYQTTTSFIHHNFHIEPRSNSAPILDLPALVAPLSTVVNLVIVGIAALAGWVLQRDIDGSRLRLARFGLFSALLIPLQPLGEEHHYILALPAVVTVLLLAAQEKDDARRAVILPFAVLGAFLIAVPLQHTHPSLIPGFRAVFAYTKLYGGLLTACALGAYLVIPQAEWRGRIDATVRALPIFTQRRLQTRRPASAHHLPDQPPRP